MSRYIQFLFAGIFRKKSIYICAIIFALLSSVFIYLGIAEANDAKKSGVNAVSGFTAWMPFVISTIFNSIIVIHCFKSGEKDGTDLIVSSKPISRIQQIMSKFIVVWLVSLIFAIYCFVVMLPICFVDDYATTENIFRFSGSISIGLIIVGFIIISIAIMVSSVLSKMGTMIISILISAVPPILSFSIIPSSGAENDVEEYVPHSSFRLLKNIKVDNADDIYKNPQKFDFGQPIFKNATAKSVKVNQDSWYKHAVYTDLWYQWNGLFSLTTSIKGQKFGYDVSHIRLKYLGNFDDVTKDKLSFPIRQHKFYLALSSFEYNLLLTQKNKVDNQKIKDLIDHLEDRTSILKWLGLDKIEDMQFFHKQEMLKKINKAIEDIKKSIITNPPNLKNALTAEESAVNNELYEAWIITKIAQYIQNLKNNLKENNNLKEDDFIKDGLKDIIQYLVISNFTFLKTASSFAISYDDKRPTEEINFENIRLYEYERQDYLNKDIVNVLWSLAAVILTGLSIFIYAKRDFK